jgi:hypothetical protein
VKRIEKLSCRVEALSTERNRPSPRDRHSSPRNSHLSTRKHRPYNKSPTRHDAATTCCWYHRRFGTRAQNCTKPCAFRQQRNPAHPTSMVAYVCTTATGRVFITDRSSKQRFLIDTGSDHSAGSVLTTTSAQLTALPSLLTDGCPSASTWDYAGISRGGLWLPMSHPHIGADFLSHFGLLAGCRNNRLLD